MKPQHTEKQIASLVVFRDATSAPSPLLTIMWFSLLPPPTNKTQQDGTIAGDSLGNVRESLSEGEV